MLYAGISKAYLADTSIIILWFGLSSPQPYPDLILEIILVWF